MYPTQSVHLSENYWLLRPVDVKKLSAFDAISVPTKKAKLQKTLQSH